MSRSIERAHGWGIPVPDDPTQVIYVWFDALTNYISALDYGTRGDLYDQWWTRADERIHVVGKGITRFHAVYWPAFLLSAGEPIPSRIQVHPYLSINGTKISKCSGSQVQPTELARDFGSDAFRWWIAADVAATSDTDFTIERLTSRANETLANGLGNAVNRITTLRHRHRSIGTTTSQIATEPLPRFAALEAEVTVALADFDRRGASERIIESINSLNRHIETTEPWKLARTPAAAAQLNDLLETYLACLRHIARTIEPITPELSRRAIDQLDSDPANEPQPVYTRLDPGTI